MSVNDTTEKRFESDIEAFFLSAAGGYTKCEDAYDPAGPVPRYTNSIHPDISAEGMAAFC